MTAVHGFFTPEHISPAAALATERWITDTAMLLLDAG